MQLRFAMSQILFSWCQGPWWQFVAHLIELRKHMGPDHDSCSPLCTRQSHGGMNNHLSSLFCHNLQAIVYCVETNNPGANKELKKKKWRKTIRGRNCNSSRVQFTSHANCCIYVASWRRLFAKCCFLQFSRVNYHFALCVDYWMLSV